MEPAAQTGEIQRGFHARIVAGGIVAVLVVTCVVAVTTVRPAGAASLATRWGGTVVFHETHVRREPAIIVNGTVSAWQETTTEASVTWTFDRPPPRPAAPDDLVKDANGLGTAKATASLHSASTDPTQTSCNTPVSDSEAGESSFTDLLQIQYDLTTKGWDLVFGIDDEFPYNKPPYKPRAVKMTGTSTWLSGCSGSGTSSTNYPVPAGLSIAGGKGVTGTSTAIRGTYTKTIDCAGIIQNPFDLNASCEPAQDYTDREEFTVTLDLQRVASAVPAGTPHRPVIKGAARPGSTLSVSLPGWTAAERGAARYRWSRCWGSSRCAHGPTSSTYHVKSTDVGSQITVAVSSTVNRHSFTLRSAATPRVTSSGGNPPVRR